MVTQIEDLPRHDEDQGMEDPRRQLRVQCEAILCYLATVVEGGPQPHPCFDPSTALSRALRAAKRASLISHALLRELSA